MFRLWQRIQLRKIMPKHKKTFGKDLWNSDQVGNLAYNSGTTNNRYEAMKQPDGSYVLNVKNHLGWNVLQVKCPSEVSLEKTVRLIENGHVTL